MKSENTVSRSAIFYQPGAVLTLEEVPIPELKSGEIRVRVEYTTLCRSDLNTFTGKRREKSPTILGHEIVGRIEKFGPETVAEDYLGHPLETGDRITWSIYASDPAAYYSKIGIPQKAAGLFKYGHEQHTPENTLHGGLSEYCVLRQNTVIIKVDENIPVPVVAVINCAVATVAAAIRLAGEADGKTVIVSGAGMLGIFACAILRTLNVRRIIAIDINQSRLEMAQRFGADTILFAGKPEAFPPASSLKAQAVLEFSGAASAMESTLDLLDIGGVAVWVGGTFPQRALRIDAEKVIRNLWTIRGLHNYTANDLVSAVNFIETYYKSFPFEDLIFDGFTLDTVNEAFEYAVASDALRVGLRISE